MRTKLFSLALVVVICFFAAENTQAVVNLGTGTGANAKILGNDLTDLGDDGNEGAYVGVGNTANFDAVFFTNSGNSGFGNRQRAFNVFDNTVGSSNEKWCCDNPNSFTGGIHVGADFSSFLASGESIALTAFTLTSDNDVNSDRDPDIYSVQGSNDGVDWIDIFTYDNDGDSQFDDFGGSQNNRTLLFSVGDDFATPETFTMFRLNVTSTVARNQLALNEIEFFGDVVNIPEPTSAVLLGLGALGMVRRRRIV